MQETGAPDRPDNLLVSANPAPTPTRITEAVTQTAGLYVRVELNDDWPQWRGRARDGRVKYLPKTLPTQPDVIWSAKLTGAGIGGVAVAGGYAVIVSRDASDLFDVIQAFDAETGESRWKHTYEAKGSLDYGNSARATPLIHGDCVYTLGAFGDLHCLELESGLPLWHRNLHKEFDAQELTWGHSGSPLIVEDKLIVQPGGKQASLVALDLDSGETIWESPGVAASYSSFMPLKLDDRTQVLGFDSESLGAWDANSGERLWKHTPPRSGDFNVPTVLIDADRAAPRLIVSSENNGTRLFEIAANGKLPEKPLAQTRQLSPDTHTPVLMGDWVLGVWTDFYALRISNHFQTILELRDIAFEQYCSVIASGQRALVLSMNGELLLIEIQDQQLKIVSRLQLEAEPFSVYSHPAIADNGFYVRLETQLVKIRLLPGANKDTKH